MRSTARLFGLGVVLASACSSPPVPAPPPGPPFTPVADVKLLMQAVVDPAADDIWDAVKIVDSAEGTVEHAPKTDAEWAAVRRSAVLISESGNLLMLPGRARDAGDWMRFSRALTETGKRAIAAADKRDKDALFEAGGEIYVACTNCHTKYMLAPSPAGP